MSFGFSNVRQRRVAPIASGPRAIADALADFAQDLGADVLAVDDLGAAAFALRYRSHRGLPPAAGFQSF